MSVLTPLDYWLDNVMANIPMVAICEHREGYVQGYQLIKTDELPRLHPNLSFHPGVVQEHANQVLRFLQTNCTQETGTYLLYKGVGDQPLKLYNVSSVPKQSTQAESIKSEKPFALPVGMMCYTLASKILQQNKPDSRTRAKDLLEKCLEMLDETKFPGVWAYAQEKMADTISTFPLPTLFGTQVPAHYNPANAEKAATTNIPPPLTVTLLKTTLNSVSQFTAEELTDAENQFVTAVHHLSKGINALAHLEKDPKHAMQVLSMKSKAAYCYYQLSKISNEKGKYGSALHWLQLSSQSIRSQQPQTIQQKVFFAALCSLCADIYVGISANMTEATIKDHQRDLDFSESPKFTALEVKKPSIPLLPSTDAKPSSSSPSTPPKPATPITTTTPISEVINITEALTLDVEENLRTSVSYYLKALGFISVDVDAQEHTNLTRRLGNAQNQLGIHYMNTARFTKAAWHFQLAVDTFKQIKDQPNVALIYCNIGKLMKVYAHNERMGNTSSTTNTTAAPSPSPSTVTGGSDPMSDKELSHYEKAIGFYENAKEVLQDRKAFPQIWDAVQSQLAATYIIMGLRTSIASDTQQPDPEQAKIASEHLLRALKMYDALKDTYQIALSHLHLGSLYGKMIRSGESDTERRSRIKVAMLHFDKAMTTFTIDQYPKEFVCVKYELAQMHEQMPTTSNPTKLSNLARSLKILAETSELFSRISNPLPQSASENLLAFSHTNTTILPSNESGQVKSKLEEIMKQALKVASSIGNSQHVHNLLKQMYKDILGVQNVGSLGTVLQTIKASAEKL